jgi:hypothetical protein
MPLFEFFLKTFLNSIVNIDTLSVRVRNKGNEHVHQDKLHGGNEYDKNEKRKRLIHLA